MESKGFKDIFNQISTPDDIDLSGTEPVNVFAIGGTDTQAQLRAKLYVASQDGAINLGSIKNKETLKIASEDNINLLMRHIRSVQYRETFKHIYKDTDNLRKDYEEFGHKIDEHKQKLAAYKQEMDKNTITLDDGTQIYKDGDAYMVRQNGEWAELDADRLDEAKAKEQDLIATGKRPATRKQADAYWNYHIGVAEAEQMQQENLQKLEQNQNNINSQNADLDDIPDMEKQNEELRDDLKNNGDEKLDQLEEQFSSELNTKNNSEPVMQKETIARFEQGTNELAYEGLADDIFGNSGIAGKGNAKEAFTVAHDGTSKPLQENTPAQEQTSPQVNEQPFKLG